MAYEQQKDKKISEKRITVGEAVIICGLYRYNDGPVKYGEIRVIQRGGKDTYAPIGRKTPEEVNATIPEMRRMISQIEAVPAKADTPSIF